MTTDTFLYPFINIYFDGAVCGYLVQMDLPDEDDFLAVNYLFLDHHGRWQPEPPTNGMYHSSGLVWRSLHDACVALGTHYSDQVD